MRITVTAGAFSKIQAANLKPVGAPPFSAGEGGIRTKIADNLEQAFRVEQALRVEQAFRPASKLTEDDGALAPEVPCCLSSTNFFAVAFRRLAPTTEC
jgi:hypothetical protein